MTTADHDKLDHDKLLPLFTEFPARRLLFEDESVVVIDKPFGLATHAPDEGRHDDVLSWLAAHYARRDEPSYLGTHQRLDRETSGVILFSRHRDANPALARQFEGRHVEKTYVAVVEGRTPDQAELRHTISPKEDGLQVAKQSMNRGRDRGGAGRDAVTDLRTLRRNKRRALVELRPKTGRTHQLRAQLAAIGAPIVGDVEYGGAPELRVMLHSARLSLHHPKTDRPIAFEAPLPADLERALRGEPPARSKDPKELARVIAEAAERRFGVIARGDTTALRLVNEEGDGLPGVTIDAYGAHLVVSLYDELADDELSALLEATRAIASGGVYLKFRPKNASRIVDSRRPEVAPATPSAGEPAPDPLEVMEEGVTHRVRLGDGLSTGLFLDQRENRKRLRALAGGQRVLNLFAYTGSFSLIAALGGASSTTSVDVSAAALERARASFAREGLDATRHTTAELDVFQFLDRAAARKETWDLIVVDPPSFSTTKASTFSAEADYGRLAAKVFKVAAPGARLLMCTNHRGITMAKLRKAIHRAAEESKVGIAQMKNLPPPTDFPPALGREPHLKTLLVTTGR